MNQDKEKKEDLELKGYPPGFPWVNQFRRFSWWLSPARQRTFLISQVWYHDDGRVKYIELVEYKCEEPKLVTFEQMLEWYNKKQMKPISSQPV